MSVSQYHEIEITSGVDTIKFTPAEYNIDYTSLVAPDSGRVMSSQMIINNWYARKLLKISITLPPHRYDDTLYSRIISYVQGQVVNVSFYDYMAHEYIPNMSMYCSSTKAGYSYKGIIEGVQFELIAMAGTNSVSHVKASYTISTSVSPSGSGTVTGGGSYVKNATATLTATPSAGYNFTKWSDENTQNPRSITVTQDKSYTAIFTAVPVQYTISTAVSPEGTGSVTGGGTYNSGSTATLTATPASGYVFSQWNDGNTSNPRAITVSGNATYTATFIVQPTEYWELDWINDPTFENDDSEMGTVWDVKGTSCPMSFVSNSQNFTSISVDENGEFIAYNSTDVWEGSGESRQWNYISSNYRTMRFYSDPEYLFGGDWTDFLFNNLDGNIRHYVNGVLQ